MEFAHKPFSTACERNKQPILEVLQQYLADVRTVLEIGSGTGQHAVHFAAKLPHLVWQCSDQAHNLPGITQWLAEAKLPNTPPALILDVNRQWPTVAYEAVFSANTLHIMSWQEVQTLFAALPMVLAPRARVILYGPFRYRGEHTSASNAAFDLALRSEAPHRGIRDFEAVDALATAAGLYLLADHAMPANNRCLVWACPASPADQGIP